MKNKGISALSFVLFAFILASCDGTYNPNGAFNRIDHDLRGTWECVEEDFWTRTKGRLVLDYDTVTIPGPVAHLQGFTREIALDAYTEDGETGLLHIKDRGGIIIAQAY
jgi:hypothetical protein